MSIALSKIFGNLKSKRGVNRYKFSDKDNDIAKAEMAIHRILKMSFDITKTQLENEIAIVSEAEKNEGKIKQILVTLARKHKIKFLKAGYEIYEDSFFVNLSEEKAKRKPLAWLNWLIGNS